MLSPNELREQCKDFRDRAIRHRIASAEDLDEMRFTLADLCEQVAELKEQRVWFGVDMGETGGDRTVITKIPQPRILKASEITEPGGYLMPISGNDLHVIKAVRLSNGQIGYHIKDGEAMWSRPITDITTDLYGPIPLPE